jgi:hypothetical protein
MSRSPVSNLLVALVFASGAAVADDRPGAAAGDQSAAGHSATYQVEAARSLRVKKGEKASARLAVVPRADSHVSPDAPVSVAVKGSRTLELPLAKLGRAEAKATAQKGVEFEVPFVAREAGPGALDADLVFFICTEKLCERHKEHVQLAIQAD